MSTQTTFDLNGLRRAIQSGDCRYPLALHADDAEVEIVDGPGPSTAPQVLCGKPAIGQWLESMSSAAVGHHVCDAVGSPDQQLPRMSGRHPAARSQRLPGSAPGSRRSR